MHYPQCQVQKQSSPYSQTHIEVPTNTLRCAESPLGKTFGEKLNALQVRPCVEYLTPIPTVHARGFSSGGCSVLRVRSKVARLLAKWMEPTRTPVHPTPRSGKIKLHRYHNSVFDPISRPHRSETVSLLRPSSIDTPRNRPPVGRLASEIAKFESKES